MSEKNNVPAPRTLNFDDRIDALLIGDDVPAYVLIVYDGKHTTVRSNIAPQGDRSREEEISDLLFMAHDSLDPSNCEIEKLQ